MTPWVCGIGDCGTRFESAEDAVVHQATAHERHECRICGTVVPAGYLAVRHAFEEHSRAEYVRAYGAEAADVRRRERVAERVEARADLERVAERLEG